uniref:Aminotransferase-like plant mobile domain-containing protein n=1 Tax=Ananas comosus var. bracteatus TaxID=296719 RepID=A0A6V7Q0E1_ANACO|nr:unnamed protein product [Ananas comosus var. bracteatus]
MIIRAGMALKTFGDRTDVDGLKDWVNDVIAQYKTQLVQAEILGAIIAFKGKYDKNPKLFKGLVELWCSETNTFHLPYGEVGISLWDIKELGGLSIIGEMYDEFVPSNSELKNYPWVLVNLLLNQEKTTSVRRNVRKHQLILRMDILAAFLALWLCKFVMPSGKKDVIRPETFIMASQMAHGTRFALAPAVLCAIQAALGRMVSDRRGPAYPYCRFPIDFLFAWVGARFEKVYTRRPIREDIKSMPGLKKVSDMLSFMYAISTSFDSKRARQHLRDERNFIWRPYSFNCSGEGWVHEVIDMRGRSDFPEEVQEWIISLRHSVLPLRLGGSLYAQPYNPHRFARQFGLDQHFPKSSDVPREAVSTGALAGYWLDLTQNIDELTLAVIAESLPTSPLGVSHADEELSLLDPEKLPSPTPEELPSPTPKGIVEELPLPTLEGFTLPIPRDTVGELPSPAPIEVEQILPSHYDDEFQEEVAVTTVEESTSLVEKNSEKIALDLDPTITKYVGSTLIGQVIDMIKTSSYRDYKTVQERVRSHCRSLSSFGINISNLEMRLQRLLMEQAAIEKVMSLPTFASSARLVTAEENLDLLEKELETCLSSQNSLRQNLEQYSSEFARIGFDPRKKIEGKSAEAERELIEAKEGYIATTELATLRDLISNFENYRKNI